MPDEQIPEPDYTIPFDAQRDGAEVDEPTDGVVIAVYGWTPGS